MHDEAFLHMCQGVCIVESFSCCLGMHTSNNGGYLTFLKGGNHLDLTRLDMLLSIVQPMRYGFIENKDIIIF